MITTTSYVPSSDRADVADLERDAVGDARGLGVPARQLDRGLVEVVAVHPDARVRGGDGDRRPADTAGDIRDTCRWIRRQATMDVRDGRQDLRPERVDQPGPVEVALRLDHVRAVVRPRHAAAGLERRQQLREHLGARDDGAADRADRPRAGPVEERLRVRLREAEPTILGRGVDVVDLEDPGRRLLLEPLARISLVDTGAPGQVGRGRGAAIAQRPVEPELVAEVDGHDVEHPEAGGEQPPGQLIRGPLDRRGARRIHRHVLPPASPTWCVDDDGTSGPVDLRPDDGWTGDGATLCPCAMCRSMADRVGGRPASPTTSTVQAADWPDLERTTRRHDAVRFLELDMSERTMSGVGFFDCTFRGTRFNGSTFRDVAFANCTFIDCGFFDVRFSSCKLVGAMFDGCRFGLLHADGGDWSLVGLPGADLRSATFTDVRMREADLTGARLDGATVRNVDLSGALLHAASFVEADLRGSDLSALDPRDADLKDALIDVEQALVIATALGLRLGG